MNTDQAIAIACTATCTGMLFWCSRVRTDYVKPLRYLLMAAGLQGVVSAAAIAKTNALDDALEQHLQAITIALIAVAACMLLIQPSQC